MILETSGLSKNFGSVKAVKNLSLQVEAGQVYGMLGPNGSGKTTTLGMLLGVTMPTAGEYKWFGRPGDHRARKRIGAILEMPVFYPYMSATQNLKITSMIKEVDESRIPEVLELVDLHKRADDKFKSFSLGMKQRLAIAAAFLADPDVMILDEPTNGLDPMGIADIRALIRKIASMGKTIILASHLLDEVQKVCSHFCVLQTGNLIYQGSVEDDFSEETIITLQAPDMDLLVGTLDNLATIQKLVREGDVIEATCLPNINAHELNRDLGAQGIHLSHLSVKKRSLEEQFLKILQDAKTV